MTKKVHLLNAAVMPTAGVYDLEQITPDAFKAGVIEAHTAGILKHYIGYKTTLDLVRYWLGINLSSVNVSQTVMADGETFLVLRLRRRVSPSAKVRTLGEHARLEIEDFDFYRGTYFESRESFMEEVPNAQTQ